MVKMKQTGMVSSVNAAGSVSTIAHQTMLAPASGRPNLDYLRSILLKFEAFVQTF